MQQIYYSLGCHDRLGSHTHTHTHTGRSQGDIRSC